MSIRRPIVVSDQTKKTMIKEREIPRQHVLLCDCTQQLSSSNSGTCETCMGFTLNQPAMDELFPVPRFDALYFEELEAYYNGIEYAA